MKSKKLIKFKNIIDQPNEEDASDWLTIPFLAMLRFLDGDRSMLPWLDRLLRKYKATFAGAGSNELRLRFGDRGYSIYVSLYLTDTSEGTEEWRLASDFADKQVSSDNGGVAPQGVIKWLKAKVSAFESDLQCGLSEGVCVPVSALTEGEREQALEMGKDRS